jgi:hypothetical protein
MRTFSSLLEVTLVAQMGKSILWIPAWLYHTDWLMKPSSPNLLDEPLKDFIVNPADLPWKWVKRLITSGKWVNHDSWWKCTTSAECKTGISAVLTVTSGLGPLQNKWWTLMIMIMISMLTNDYCFLLYIIPVYMIMRLFGLMVNLLYSIAKRWLNKS